MQVSREEPLDNVLVIPFPNRLARPGLNRYRPDMLRHSPFRNMDVTDAFLFKKLRKIPLTKFWAVHTYRGYDGYLIASGHLQISESPAVPQLRDLHTRE